MSPRSPAGGDGGRNENALPRGCRTIDPFGLSSTMPRTCYVYILASQDRHLYVGVTNDLARRMHEHRALRPDSYVARHCIMRLVYYEMAPDCRGAVIREKQIKRWRRVQRLELIESFNPEWRDLFEIPARFELRPPSPPAGAPG